MDGEGGELKCMFEFFSLMRLQGLRAHKRAIINYDANIKVKVKYEVSFNVDIINCTHHSLRMYVITFANPKGGSGKTTSAMLLAEQIALSGGRVAILDLDPNANILGWARGRRQELAIRCSCASTDRRHREHDRRNGGASGLSHHRP